MFSSEKLLNCEVKAEWPGVILRLSCIDYFYFEVNWSELLNFLLLYLTSFSRLLHKHFRFVADLYSD